MDEPSAGLSPLYVKEVIAVLAQFRAKQLALLIAEQNVKFLVLGDRVYTLDNGRMGFSGSVAAVCPVMDSNSALLKETTVILAWFLPPVATFGSS